ncbi:MAG TPA: porin [Alphaproteobacteria bacterium]
MKKYLLGTTALVAAGMLATADTASAQTKVQPVQVSVGGYFYSYLGWVDQDVDGPVAVDQQTDAEIHFNGRTVLDNGLTVGVRVELEANTESDQIDESYAFVEGAFGRIEAGTINNVAYRMHYKAPDVGKGLVANEGNYPNWIQNITSSSFNDTALGQTSLRAGDNDSDKINYYTPRIAGFQLGVSYIPEMSQDRSTTIARDDFTYNTGWSAGINYVQSFGAFDIAASAGYLTFEAPEGTTADDLKAFSAGLQVGFGGFKVGGSYAQIEDGVQVSNANITATTFTGSTVQNDGQSWDVGVSYTFGPAAVSVNYFHGENEPVAGGGDDEWTLYQLTGVYTLGPGVQLQGTLFRGEFEAASGEENEGTGIITGLLLVF